MVARGMSIFKRLIMDKSSTALFLNSISCCCSKYDQTVTMAPSHDLGVVCDAAAGSNLAVGTCKYNTVVIILYLPH